MNLIATLVTALAVTGAWSANGIPQEESALGWPREFIEDGHLIVVYQPQPEIFEGDRLSGRAAVSVTPEGQNGPIFGAFWFEAFVETDREKRVVNIVDVEVPRVRFPEGTEEHRRQLADILALEISDWDLVVSLDRLLTSLEVAEGERLSSANLAVDPPRIIVATEPSILVTLDGKAVLRDVDDTDLQRVVNTPFVILYDRGSNTYYLYAGNEAWLATSDLMGRWELSEETPEEVTSLISPATAQAADAESEDEPGIEDVDFDIEDVNVIVATEPTELIVFDGPPNYASIDGTDLLYVSNSESDVFLDIGSQEFYVVLSGRWYESPSLDGPWTFVASDSLPGDFAKIPPESARGSVLVYVAGTDEARDAVLDHSIPQTAAVKRDATLEITYDGEPEFEPIEGTEMAYAVNTEYQVLEIDSRYYVCYEAVWYESDDPEGPYAVSVTVPDDVQEIPAENPNYNVKYVYIYDSTPDIVYVGYTPGYMWSFVYGPTIVYGTGWWYRPWISPYYYYPRPVTWGFHVSYNPWYGWNFGLGFSYGRFHFGFRAGPSYGYRPGWWGPAGYRHGYYHGYHRGYGTGYRYGYRAGYYAGRRQANLYNRPQNAARNVDRATARSQLSNRRAAAATQPSRGAAAQPSRGAVTQPSQQGRVSRDRPNNVYADRDGNIYRRGQDGGWEQRDRGGWSSSGQTRDLNRQPASGPPSNLNRDYRARQRGTQRTQDYSRARAVRGTRGGGGRRR